MTTLPVEQITTDGRHRTDLGDIAGLADSISEVGLLHPVVVTPDLRLVAGERRLAAVRHLGWTDVPVTVVTSLTDAYDLLRAESDENTCRKSFTPSEAESIAAAREAMLRPLATAAKAQAPGEPQGTKVSSANFAGETRKAAATGTGYSHETIRKVREVKETIESETTPEPVREVARQALAEMDSTGRVDGAHKRVTEAQKIASAVADFPDLAYFAETRSAMEVLGIAAALRGYTEPELSMRLDNLRRSVAAAKRRDAEPTPDPTPDYYALADRMFVACNNAASAITTGGGADSVRAALIDAQPLAIEMWRRTFADLADTCRALADECAPTLRRVK